MQKISHRILFFIWCLFIIGYLFDAFSSWFVSHNVDLTTAYETNTQLDPHEQRLSIYLLSNVSFYIIVTSIFLAIFLAPRAYLKSSRVDSIISTFTLAIVMISFVKLWAAAENLSLGIFGSNTIHYVRLLIEQTGLFTFDTREKARMLTTAVSTVIAIPASFLFFTIVSYFGKASKKDIDVP